jgi:hypothetical protein
MFQCLWCWIYTKHYQELCPHCGAECVVMIEEEDWQEYGWKREKQGAFNLALREV